MSSDISTYSRALEAAEYIKKQLPAKLHGTKTAIICGSGLSGITNLLQDSVSLNYSDIPGFKTSTVAGHSGKLVAGFLGETTSSETQIPVLCMSGRLHTYEGYDIQDTVFPVRAFAAFGIENLIVTNAAGGLNPEFAVGDVMLINDHINIPGLAGLHPLKGPNDPRLGERFLALSDAYDHDLRVKFFQAARNLRVVRKIHEGTYVYVSGPTYESRAEVRYLKSIGGDTVGMSTVPEVIVARHAGLRVLALSLVTNVAVTDKPPSAKDMIEGSAELSRGKATHEEVVAAGNEAAKDIEKIVQEVVVRLG